MSKGVLIGKRNVLRNFPGILLLPLFFLIFFKKAWKGFPARKTRKSCVFRRQDCLFEAGNDTCDHTKAFRVSEVNILYIIKYNFG